MQPFVVYSESFHWFVIYFIIIFFRYAQLYFNVLVSRKDIGNRFIFEGDQIGFTEDVFGVVVSRKGTVVRADTGMWTVVDVITPFVLHDVKDRIILGHIYEGV